MPSRLSRPAWLRLRLAAPPDALQPPQRSPAPGEDAAAAAARQARQDAVLAGYIGRLLIFQLLGLLAGLGYLLSLSPIVPGSMAVPVTAEEQQVLAVLLAGALGGCLHVATSFSDYVGNQQFRSQWGWWYLLRPLSGAALALIFFAAVKAGGLVGSGGDAGSSLYLLVVVGAVAGLFSKQATDKLDDLMDIVLKTGKDDNRSDGLEQPGDNVPVIDRLKPTSAPQGTALSEITVSGRGFATGARAKFNGAPRDVVFVGATELRVKLVAADLGAIGRFPLQIVSAASPPLASNAMEFEVTGIALPPVPNGNGGGGGEPAAEPAPPPEAKPDELPVGVLEDRRETPGTPDDRANPAAGVDADAKPAAGTPGAEGEQGP